MPVSQACDATANVNAALRESLNGGCATVDETIKISGPVDIITDNDDDDSAESLQTKLAASSKRVLLNTIEYEEADSFGHTVLDSYKTKYTNLKANPINAQVNGENGSGSGAYCANGLYESINGNCVDMNGETEGNGNGNCNGNGNINNNINSNNNSNSNGNINLNGKTNGHLPQLSSGALKRVNHELPQPKRILYPRENIRIGWNNSLREWQVGVGMMNVGNTCYLNSTLQALFHVPSMANWLVSEQKHIEQCEAAEHGCIICSMAKTLEAAQSSSSAIRPYYIYSKLKMICKHLATCRQEDAHEFLRYLVESMEKSYLSRFRNYKELDQYTKETTPLNQIFGGYLRSAVRCLSCNHVSITFQHFQDLLLDIRKADTIDQALEGYFSRERLEDMGYKCESCKKKVSATKQFTLERAPIALCIQLKRFSVLGVKLNKQVAITTRIDLSRFSSSKNTGEHLVYKLVAMISHLGTSQHCGHYTAIGLTESGTYYDYDDSYVRPIPVQSVCNTNAYIIFYELDTSVQRQLPNNQLNGVETKENVQKMNGFLSANKSHNGSQQMIGPQLPPGSSLHNHNQNQNTALHSNVNNGIKPNMTNGSAYSSSGNNKLIMNKGNGLTTTNGNANKITIHYKNNNTLVKRCTPSAGSQITLSNGVHQNGNDNGNLHNGNGAASSSGTNSISKSLHVSTLNGHNKANHVSTLPSMPNLVASNDNDLSQNSIGPKSPIAPKSLVPYDIESEEEAKRVQPSTSSQGALKRRSASISSSEDNDDDLGMTSSKLKKVSMSSSNGIVSPKTTSTVEKNGDATKSGFKSKTSAIDDIFKTNQNLTNGNQSTATVSPLIKKVKNHLQHLDFQAQGNGEALITTNAKRTASPSFPSYGSNNDMLEQSSERRPFKRSQSTPPSSPVIKTKSGLWQVSNISASSIDNVDSNASKNPNNPFASKKIDVGPQHRKKVMNGGTINSNGVNGEKRNGYTAHNGYPHDVTDDNVVGELLKQNHRGYGGTVLTWDGEPSAIEKEINGDAHEQRQQDWEDEEDSEMDRGRQKKVKNSRETTNSSTVTPGYNVFQEHENQRRWNKGGNHRFHNNSNYRFQRNKFKYQRFNYKFPRNANTSIYTKNNMNTNGNNFNRRDS